MKTLYEITTQQRELIAEIEWLEGEITPEMEQSLAITKQELETKSMAYLEVINRKGAFDSLIDNEIKRLQAIKKQNGNITSRLKENLLNAVKTFGEFTIGTHKFTTRKSSSVEVEDVNGLPNEFKVVKVTEQADKMALKKAIQEGKEIKGVFIVEHFNLAIK